MFGKPRRALDDPTLGRLALDKFGWSGDGRLRFGGVVPSVRVNRKRDPPNESDRLAYETASNTYGLNTPKLQSALFTLWEPYLQESHWVDPPRTSQELWAKLQLEGVTVRADGKVHLHYAFEDDFWPDASLTVQTDGTAVQPLYLDD